MLTLFVYVRAMRTRVVRNPWPFSPISPLFVHCAWNRASLHSKGERWGDAQRVLLHSIGSALCLWMTDTDWLTIADHSFRHCQSIDSSLPFWSLSTKAIKRDVESDVERAAFLQIIVCDEELGLNYTERHVLNYQSFLVFWLFWREMNEIDMNLSELLNRFLQKRSVLWVLTLKPI